MVIVALSDVSPLGVKLTGIVQAVLPAHERTGVTPKSAALGPEMVSPTISGNGDELVTFKKLKVRVDDCTTFPNAIVVYGSVSGIVGPVLSATVSGPSGSGLSAIDIAADSVPSAPGLKVTVRLQELLAARVLVQVPPVIEKSEGLAPLKLSLSVTGCVWIIDHREGSYPVRPNLTLP